MKPTPEQIATELAKLKDLAPRIRQINGFGGNNRAKIEAEIDILENGAHRLSRYEVDETCDDHGEDDFEIEAAARDAVTWLETGDLDGQKTISEGWEPLVVA